MKFLSTLFHLFVLGGLGFIFYDSFASLFLSWIYDSNYQHGFFVLVVSCVLIIYTLRKDLFSLFLLKKNIEEGLSQVSLWKKSLPFWFIGFVLVGIGAFYGSQYLILVSFLFLIRAWGVFILGRQGSVLSFPLFYLFLAFPIPGLSYCTIYLQRWIAEFSSFIMWKFGFFVVNEGNHLHLLNNISFEIVPECTGIHSFLTLISVIVLIIYFLKTENWKKFFLIILSFPVAMLSNFLRILTLLFLAIGFGEEVALGFWKYLGGVFFYLVALSTLLCVLYFMKIPLKGAFLRNVSE
ncbi:MAG: exosortase/archaeosortase family protein [Deltaproteobacteria bacterium]|nr:exosortase/archaeosortase family protein [Deltaproteobacteria bacterium]